MNFQEYQKNWSELGKTDAMWVVLTDPEKKGGRWTESDFFAAGQRDVDAILQRLAAEGVSLSNRDRALDFGCGLGRLTRGLASHFKEVVGVDISDSMIGQARDLNRNFSGCRFHLNSRTDLADFGSGEFDFCFSLISLQHTGPKFQESYIAEFMRLLRPGGIAYFQTVSGYGWRAKFPYWAANLVRKWRHGNTPFIPMNPIPTRTVERIVSANGGKLLKTWQTAHPPRFLNDEYLVAR